MTTKTRKTGPAITATSSTGPQPDGGSLSFRCPWEGREEKKKTDVLRKLSFLCGIFFVFSQSPGDFSLGDRSNNSVKVGLIVRQAKCSGNPKKKMELQEWDQGLWAVFIHFFKTGVCSGLAVHLPFELKQLARAPCSLFPFCPSTNSELEPEDNYLLFWAQVRPPHCSHGK